MANVDKIGKYRGFVVDIDAPGFPNIALDYYEPVTLSISADWRETSIRLRSEPHHTYVGTRARVVTINAKIPASVEQNDGGTIDEVTNKIRFLDSLNYPDYGMGEDFIRPPHRVRLWLAGIISEQGYIRDLNVTYEGISSKEGNPLLATVQFSFVVVHDSPLSYSNFASDTILGNVGT